MAQTGTADFVSPAPAGRPRVHIGLVGGISRLKKHYVDEAERLGIELRVFDVLRGDIAGRIENLDALVIFTSQIAHCTKNGVMRTARAKEIRVVLCHSCGICSLRECMACLRGLPVGGTRNEEQGAAPRDQAGSR
ncbi:MAG: DUF2325 domain-containing protein [Deltaproteobacteria bacterium]|nr:DUF2325 domain-containing protein [Deltaproteobacteria bacterium]